MVAEAHDRRAVILHAARAAVAPLRQRLAVRTRGARRLAARRTRGLAAA